MVRSGLAASGGIEHSAMFSDMDFQGDPHEYLASVLEEFAVHNKDAIRKSIAESGLFKASSCGSPHIHKIPETVRDKLFNFYAFEMVQQTDASKAQIARKATDLLSKRVGLAWSVTTANDQLDGWSCTIHATRNFVGKPCAQADAQTGAQPST